MMHGKYYYVWWSLLGILVLVCFLVMLAVWFGLIGSYVTCESNGVEVPC